MTRMCLHCLRGLDDGLFARNKHRPDGSGRSSYCLECCADPAVWHLAENERKLDWKYRDPQRRAAQETNRRVAARHKAEREERTAGRLAMERVYDGKHKPCIECGEDKPLSEFPHNHYARPREIAMEHSGRCKACWDVHPDGKRELARERARDHSMARAYAPDDSRLGHARKRKNIRDELYSEGVRLGVEPHRWIEMATEERNTIRYDYVSGRIAARVPVLHQEPDPRVTFLSLPAGPDMLAAYAAAEEEYPPFDPDADDGRSLEEIKAELDRLLGDA